MIWFAPRSAARRQPRNKPLVSGRKRRRSTFEALEPRLALATLGLGLRVLDDNAGAPGAPRTAPLEVGDIFWVEVLAEDQRANAAGIVSLPLNLSWDSDNLELLNPPTQFFPTPLDPLPPASLLVTSDFPLNRFVDAFAPAAGHTGFVEPPGTITIPAIPSLGALRGAALPNAGSGQAIGDDPTDPANFGFFGQLRFRALEAGDDTPFTIQLAGSMAFADADVLDAIAALTAAVRQDREDINGPPVVTGPTGPELAVTEFIEIVAAPSTTSLSGFVFADTNVNGMFDKAADGTPLEIGLPNVEIQLFRQGETAPILVTTTGPDGWYHFEDLQPGVFTVVEIQPARYVNSASELGFILASPAGGGGDPPNAEARRGVAAVNQFSQIELRGGEHGIDYNFGENLIPTKNEFRARTIPRVALHRQLGVQTAVVNATTAADQIDVEVTPFDVIVTVNNAVPRVFDRALFDIVVIDCQDEEDLVTVTVVSPDEDEVAHFLPGQAALRVGEDFVGTNYGLLAIAAEEADITAGTGGNDLAVIRDTRQTDDALVSLTSTAELTSVANRLARATGFTRVRAVTTAPTGGPEDDTSSTAAIDFVLELVGNWNEI